MPGSWGGEREVMGVLQVGYVPGFPGAPSRAESLDELRENLREVIALLLEDGEPKHRKPGGAG